MFRGVTALTIDSKGRVAMPARYRDALLVRAEGRLVITADSALCLLIYPAPDWEPIQAKLMALSSFNERTRDLQRLLVGNASDVEMDSAGRILVPGPLRKFAALDKDVALVGQGARFELWDEAKWAEQMQRAIERNGGGIPPELEGFSL
ncbi:MAG TPA: division/cell wall cluster transcriptional repressor MraZ [Burkholderiales bacterium]|nr:division/cell wall cluster transcriptional repressor MraZ [Burkholderiales bacterium]